jgi:Cu(I)/Ag(I) efflux system membrane fusion protein
MTLAELVSRHRHKIVPAVVLTVLIAVALLFRTELAVWFSGESPPTTVSSTGTTVDVAAEAQSLPAREFDEATFEQLRAAFSVYDEVRALLARDSTEGLDVQARRAATALHAAAKGAAGYPAAITGTLGRASEAADSLAKAGDVAAARRPFGELSQALIALGGADPRLAEGLQLFECPMAKGFGQWFQASSRPENPYMGEKMLQCAVPTEWEQAASTEAHVHEQGQGGSGDEISHYTCAMHPSVEMDGPGKCPICGMELTPVTKREVETGTIFVDETRRQRIGVRTEAVTKRQMTLPIQAVGAVRYDESRLHDVNLRMSGWVERLSVDETGQRVKAGQTLFTLYSPELYAAQLEHLASVKRQAEGGEMLSQLAQASRTRLRLLGMSAAQIAGLEKRGEAQENVPILSPAAGYVIDKQVVEGARVEAGTRVYRIADLSRVWIDAEIYESDLPHVRVGQSASVELPYVPDKRFSGKVDYVYPTLEGQTRTGRARIVLDNPGLELKPEMYANVSFQVDLGERLAVRDSAVIYTGPRRLVFVDLGEGKLQPRHVELGIHAGEFYEITGGLSEGDVVVTSGNFLIAAESRIRSATKYWESGHAH